jgi:hypoxanthine phosphoribosyltransferase
MLISFDHDVMPKLIPILEKDQIEKLVGNIAQSISADYKGHELILIGILKGSFVFLSDLIRRLSIPVQIDFIGTSSYERGMSSSGNIRLTKTLDIDIKDKDVLLVEDIVDTGLTVSYCMDYLNSFYPRTLKLCAMVDKYQRRKREVGVNYACYKTNEGFLVGYGLDYNQRYRELAGIYTLKF